MRPGDRVAFSVRPSVDAVVLALAVTLLGRKKDMLLRGTQNIYVGLYEPVIASLPGVADVAMVGVPDEIGDDRVVVAVVPAGAPDDLPADLTHPLAQRVAAALPGLIDRGALPDLVVAIGALPRRGRMRKPDRPALVALVAPLVDAAAGLAAGGAEPW